MQNQLAAIRRQVEGAQTLKAINLLMELSKQVGVRDFLDQVSLLRSRMKKIEQDNVSGILKSEEYTLRLNTINKDILDLLNRYESGEWQQPLASPRDQGRIVHNIPDKMKKNVVVECKVRIAKNDEILLAGLDPEKINRPEPIETSSSMEVELVDPAFGEVFQIQRNNAAKQTIVSHTFTEWEFSIRCLKTGRHTLNLYVYFIDQDRDGKEQRRSIPFKREIEITTEAVEVSKRWYFTNILFGKKQKKRRLFAFLKPAALNAKTMAVGLLILSALAYLVYKYIPLPPPVPPKKQEEPQRDTARVIQLIQPVLRINTKLRVTMVIVNDTSILDWTTNQDSSEIYLPQRLPGKLSVTVKGTNGYCNQIFDLNESNRTIAMGCHINPPPPPPPPSKIYQLRIITPFPNPVLTFNGREQKSDSASVLFRKNAFVTKYSLKANEYTIKISQQGNLYFCVDSIKRIKLDRDTFQSFSCTAVRYKVIFKIIDIKNLKAANIKLYMDGSELPISGIANQYTAPGGIIWRPLYFEVPNVRPGEHKFQVKVCNGREISKIINKNNFTIEYSLPHPCPNVDD